MGKQNALRIAFVGLALAFLTLVAREFDAPRKTLRELGSGPEYALVQSLAGDGWGLVVGGLLTLLGAYFWLNARGPSASSTQRG